MAQITHGATINYSMTPEYRAWNNMKARTRGYTDDHQHEYVDRGIIVCSEWENDFKAFLAHIGMRPSPLHSVDRIDNDKGYEPGNIRWATPSEQANNRRPAQFKDRTGENNSKAKLTEADVLAIRADTRGLDRVAKDYGVNRSLIHKIRHRKCWKHI